jgi:homoserine O-succinyltransferase
MDWAWYNVASTITACMATHFVMQFRYHQMRTINTEKRVGIFKSRVRERSHPIVQGMNTVFDVPHSRYSDISWAQFEQAGMRVLVNSFEGGVHMASSRDGFRLICFQGHQEYDTVSLLKEYKRDMLLVAQGKLEKAAFPVHYFSSEAMEIIEKFKQNPNPDHFPEDEITPLIENTWRDSARAIIGNWIGKVYQTTNINRHKQYMDGIDPENPLGI